MISISNDIKYQIISKYQTNDIKQKARSYLHREVNLSVPGIIFS